MVTGVAAGVLAAGAAGVVIAHAAGPRASAAKTNGGLAMSHVTISRQAVAGASDVVNVANHSATALDVTVTARPWIQSSSARVVPNRRATLHDVGLSESSFRLEPGKDKNVT